MQISKRREEKYMLNPKYERKEAAQCAGCTVVSMIAGFMPDMNFLSWACINNINALAY